MCSKSVEVTEVVSEVGPEGVWITRWPSLGHVISPEGVSVDLERINVTVSREVITTAWELDLSCLASC